MTNKLDVEDGPFLFFFFFFLHRAQVTVVSAHSLDEGHTAPGTFLGPFPSPFSSPSLASGCRRGTSRRAVHATGKDAGERAAKPADGADAIVLFSFFSPSFPPFFSTPPTHASTVREHAN